MEGSSCDLNPVPVELVGRGLPLVLTPLWVLLPQESNVWGPLEK